MTKKEQGSSSGPGSSSGGENNNKNPHLFSSVVGSSSSSSSSSSKQQHQKSAAKSTSMLYHPSVFRYTCTGRLSLDSRNGGNSKSSSGVCHGIQSNLEHIDHWRLSTRDDAIKHFEYASAMGGDVGGIGNSSDAGEQSSDQEVSAAHAQQAVYLSNVLLYPPDDDVPVGDSKNKGDDNNVNDDDDDEKDNKKNKKKEKMVSRKNTDGSTTITPQQETWSCYGSTEVDLLVLRPQNEKEESIACVSSYCAPGITVRDLAVSPNINNDNSNSRERTTTVRLGILEIVYATTIEGDDDNDTTTNNNNKTIGSTAKPSNNQTAGDDDDNSKETTTTGGGSGSWITNYATAPGKVIHSGKNIIKHMSINGQILYQSVQEDYPKRTYEASQRITKEFSK
ncbi:MAG: hypothetical protein ACI8RD_014939, partial [Bacillariaceae sp.]